MPQNTRIWHNSASPMFICCVIPEIECFACFPSTKSFSIMFNEHDAEGFRRTALSREPCNPNDSCILALVSTLDVYGRKMQNLLSNCIFSNTPQCSRHLQLQKVGMQQQDCGDSMQKYYRQFLQRRDGERSQTVHTIVQ